MDSILSFKISFGLVLVILALIAFWTAMELFGTKAPMFSENSLRKLHIINGRVFTISFLIGICLYVYSLLRIKIELSYMIMFYVFLGLSILVLLLIKIAILKRYRLFYSYAKVLGIIIVYLTWILVGLNFINSLLI